MIGGSQMNRIKFLREKKGWSQAKLGSALNVQNAAISKYENGTVGLTDEVLKKMSEIFSCSIDYILCNDRNFENSDSEEKFNGDEINLVADYRKLGIPQKNFLLSIMAFLRSPQAKNVGGIVQNSKGDNCFLAVGNGNNYVAGA